MPPFHPFWGPLLPFPPWPWPLCASSTLSFAWLAAPQQPCLTLLLVAFSPLPPAPTLGPPISTSPQLPSQQSPELVALSPFPASDSLVLSASPVQAPLLPSPFPVAAFLH
ncbi:unnamed protein product [Chrysoparadoxa australica]